MKPTMEYLLYKLKDLTREAAVKDTPQIAGEITEFSPFNVSWFFRMFRAGGMKYIKSIVMATWSVLSGVASASEIQIYAFVGRNGRVLHYSVVSPTTMHLPWLKEEVAGFEIGGCLTVPAARGRKIYTHVLHEISRTAEHTKPFYMIVEDTNAASRAGIKQAGFELAHKVYRKRGSTRPPRYEYRSND